MENPPFEDVFPIENGSFPLLCLFTRGYYVCLFLFFFSAALIKMIGAPLARPSAFVVHHMSLFLVAKIVRTTVMNLPGIIEGSRVQGLYPPPPRI